MDFLWFETMACSNMYDLVSASVCVQAANHNLRETIEALLLRRYVQFQAYNFFVWQSRPSPASA